jgi:hypothetical protein
MITFPVNALLTVCDVAHLDAGPSREGELAATRAS